MPTAVFMIRLAALYVLIEAVLLVFIGALRGAGDTLWAMLMSVTTHWIMFFIAFLSFHVFHFSAETAWTYMVLLFVMFSIAVYMRYRSGNWKKIRLIHEPEAILHGDGMHEPDAI